MVDYRYQVAQIGIAGAAALAALAVLTLMFGSVVLGVFWLLLEHAAAAVGCWYLAESKGYPPWIGLPLGVSFGVVGGLVITVLPNEAEEDIRAAELRPSPEAMKNARRDPGYEVLDDEDE